jgi:hypothetical protein
MDRVRVEMMNWLRGLRFRWRIWRLAQGDVRRYGFVKCHGCGNFVRLVKGRCELCSELVKPTEKVRGGYQPALGPKPSPPTSGSGIS